MLPSQTLYKQRTLERPHFVPDVSSLLCRSRRAVVDKELLRQDGRLLLTHDVLYLVPGNSNMSVSNPVVATRKKKKG